MENYKKIYAIKKNNEEKIKRICPNLENKSGVYVFYKTDELGFKKCYVGQAKKLISRIASHLTEYDHIALSLKKYGFYDSLNNICGWRIWYKYCPIEALDKLEQELLLDWHRNGGYIPYNKTSGGQKGKVGIAENKPPKTYRDGLKQGYINAQRDIAKLFRKNLIFNTATQNVNKNQQKALEKFREFIGGENGK